MAEAVAVEWQDGKIVLSGALDGEFPGPPEGSDRLVSFSDGTLLRCARTTEGFRVVAVVRGAGTVEQYRAECPRGCSGCEAVEMNGVPYQWAMSGGQVILNPLVGA